MMFVGWLLFCVRCVLLLVVRSYWCVVCCVLYIVCCVLVVGCFVCLVLSRGSSLFVCCLWFVCWLFVVCLLSVVMCIACDARCASSVVRCLLFVV